MVYRQLTIHVDIANHLGNTIHRISACLHAQWIGAFFHGLLNVFILSILFCFRTSSGSLFVTNLSFQFRIWIIMMWVCRSTFVRCIYWGCTSVVTYFFLRAGCMQTRSVLAIFQYNNNNSQLCVALCIWIDFDGFKNHKKKASDTHTTFNIRIKDYINDYYPCNQYEPSNNIYRIRHIHLSEHTHLVGGSICSFHFTCNKSSKITKKKIIYNLKWKTVHATRAYVISSNHDSKGGYLSAHMSSASRRQSNNIKKCTQYNIVCIKGFFACPTSHLYVGCFLAILLLRPRPVDMRIFDSFFPTQHTRHLRRIVIYYNIHWCSLSYMLSIFGLESNWSIALSAT